MMHTDEFARWVVLLVFVVGAGWFVNSAVVDYGLEFESEAQVAAVFSAGKVVGVSGEHVLVSFKDGVDDVKKGQFMKKYGLKERGYLPDLGVHVFEIGKTKKPDAVAASLTLDTDVAYAEPDYLIEPAQVPDDPWYANWQKNKVQLNLPAAWDVTTGASSVVVAVADTGTNCTHEDLMRNCGGGNSDIHGHGTAVAGVIGGAGNNGVGVSGTVWQVTLMPYTVSDTTGAASYSAIANAITDAANKGARVVNNSYQSGGSQTVQKAARYLAQKGGVLVVSAGNFGTETGVSQSAYIVSVSAIDASDARYSWSSYGADVDVAAPGCTGATTARSGGYGSFCGTSSATADVSGVLALIFAANPALRAADAVAVLTTSTVDLGAPGWDPEYGWGKVDARGAVEKAKAYTPTVTETRGQKKN